MASWFLESIAKGTKESISSFSNAVWKASVICTSIPLKEQSWVQLCGCEAFLGSGLSEMAPRALTIWTLCLSWSSLRRLRRRGLGGSITGGGFGEFKDSKEGKAISAFSLCFLLVLRDVSLSSCACHHACYLCHESLPRWILRSGTGSQTNPASLSCLGYGVYHNSRQVADMPWKTHGLCECPSFSSSAWGCPAPFHPQWG